VCFSATRPKSAEQAAALRDRLVKFGVRGFAAHADIRPTGERLDEIENALTSMEAFVALLTPGFHSSDWMDQEAGYALAHGVPLIGLELGTEPYGFIGRFQALSCTLEDAPVQLARLMIKQSRMLDCYISALPRCHNFDHANMLSPLLPEIEKLDAGQAGKILEAYNTNDQLQGSYGFSGEEPSFHGVGLAAHLSRITGRRYVRTAMGRG